MSVLTEEHGIPLLHMRTDSGVIRVLFNPDTDPYETDKWRKVRIQTYIGDGFDDGGYMTERDTWSVIKSGRHHSYFTIRETGDECDYWGVHLITLSIDMPRIPGDIQSSPIYIDYVSALIEPMGAPGHQGFTRYFNQSEVVTWKAVADWVIETLMLERKCAVAVRLQLSKLWLDMLPLPPGAKK